jgi:hypothetical protein
VIGFAYSVKNATQLVGLPEVGENQVFAVSASRTSSHRAPIKPIYSARNA